MTNRLVSLLALLAVACGGSVAEPAGGGGSAGAGATAGGGGAPTGSAGAGIGAGAGASGSPGVGGVGAFGGGGTGSNADCGPLEPQLYAAVMQALECPLNSTQPTCTQPIDLTIDGCGYWGYVDASNVKALAEISKVQAQWKDMGCGPTTVCALGGYPAQPAHCEADGQGGTTGNCVTN